MLAPLAAWAADQADDQSEKEVLSRYFAASAANADALRGTATEVEIDATVPKLKKEGKLRALRSISKLGKITYKILGFQGDNVIKNEVIARYLEAEQQAQDSQKLAINNQNYKFKYKGTHKLRDNSVIYVFFLSPRKKLVGLFKGEMWLDYNTYLPVMEKGRFVKNPSVFFKKVEFVREYKIENGKPVPMHMDSTIDARVVGKVNLSIDYATPAHEPTAVGAASSPTSSAGASNTSVRAFTSPH
jgi:hypothetical protein